MKKIMIIGSGGSGKSTLATQLSKKLEIKVYHLDALLWKPNWIAVSKKEQVNIQKDLVSIQEWIIDGNYGGTMDIRFLAADTIIFLDMHRIRCVYNVLKRIWKYRKQTRPDMREGNIERFDLTFLNWIWQYPKTKRPKIVNKLEQLSGEKTIILLTSPNEVRVFLNQIESS